MAVNKGVLKSDIEALLSEMREQTEENDSAFADGLATLIDNYIKSATVTVQAGQTVLAGTYAGQTTSPGTGSLS
jgi:hypothetical protein